VSSGSQPILRSIDNAADIPRLHGVLWRDYSDFLLHRRAWNALVGTIPGASVFLRHEWFDAAWQWAQRDSQLYVLAFFDGEALVGIAPLIVQRERTPLRLRRLSFLTVPDTQVCDVIVRASLRKPVLEALAQELRARRAHWDLIELGYLPRAAADELAERFGAAGLLAHTGDQGANPSITLSGGWDAYYGRRSRRLKKGNNLIANKLEKSGRKVELEQLDCTTDWDGDVESLVQRLVSVSARSWKQDTRMSLDFAGPNAFIRRLSEHAAREGWLSLWFLSLGGDTVAMEYQLRYGGDVHALRSDFDAAAGELSPGTYLNWQMLQRLFDSGATRYLMGPGDNRYKLRWAEEYDPIARLTVYGTSPAGRCKRLADTVLRPWARALRRRLRPTSENQEDSP